MDFYEVAAPEEDEFWGDQDVVPDSVASDIDSDKGVGFFEGAEAVEKAMRNLVKKWGMDWSKVHQIGVDLWKKKVVGKRRADSEVESNSKKS